MSICPLIMKNHWNVPYLGRKNLAMSLNGIIF